MAVIAPEALPNVKAILLIVLPEPLPPIVTVPVAVLFIPFILQVAVVVPVVPTVMELAMLVLPMLLDEMVKPAVPLVAVFLHRLPNDAFKLFGNCGIEGHGRRGFGVQHRIQSHDHVVAGERLLARGHFVEHYTEGK